MLNKTCFFKNSELYCNSYPMISYNILDTIFIVRHWKEKSDDNICVCADFMRPKKVITKCTE